jgi:PTH1 family peptidyl-tRNA hydrolase
VKLIVGLGNPGRRYERTRHNVGWWVVDHLADVWHFGSWREDLNALTAGGRLGTTLVRLLKPTTFMNLSGEALVRFLKRPSFVPAQDLLVIVDDVALPLGTVRFRARGSSGGHNGLKSIEAALGSPGYARLRVGILPDDPARVGVDLADFVLAPFAAAEREIVLEQLPRATEIVEQWLGGAR